MSRFVRPYQIVLAGLAVLAVGFMLYRHHSSSGETEVSSRQPAAKHTASPPKSQASPSPIYHGAAPGVEGLSKAVAKAHEAVANSQKQAQKLQEESAKASDEAPSHSGTGTSSSSPSTRRTPPRAGASSSRHTAPTSGAHTRSPSSSTTSSSSSSSSSSSPSSSSPGASSSQAGATPTGQHEVEAALAGGKVPIVLFWNPAGADDEAVHRQVQEVGHSRLPVAVFEGGPEAVASYGAITRQIPIYGTPTILVIAKSGKTSVLTGLQERFSIEQAVEEARQS